MDNTATIFALATSVGRGALNVVRLSGPQAGTALQTLTRAPLPQPRHATLCALAHPTDGTVIDKALVLYFKAPHSFTGEDVVELHLHGGRAILNAVTEILRRLPGTRPAEAGEFTRRAFENGKMDLTEAEAIADLVAAETEAQRRQALRQMDGALGTLYGDWAKALQKLLAHGEAALDFSDEEIPADLAVHQGDAIRRLRDAIDAHLSDHQRGERLREGFSVAILGAPNAGKSSLLNALAAREAAIVSPIAGTTRDIIEVELDLGGYPVALADTAGLRESADGIENEGIKRALARADKADLKILLHDGVTWPALDPATEALRDDHSLVVVNKQDVMRVPPSAGPDAPLFISTRTGEGLKELTGKLIAYFETHFGVTAAPALTRARHRTALEECSASLSRALEAPALELRTEDLRLALRALGRITGRVDVEDLLDQIFRDFCIGK